MNIAKKIPKVQFLPAITVVTCQAGLGSYLKSWWLSHTFSVLPVPTCGNDHPWCRRHFFFIHVDFHCQVQRHIYRWANVRFKGVQMSMAAVTCLWGCSAWGPLFHGYLMGYSLMVYRVLCPDLGTCHNGIQSAVPWSGDLPWWYTIYIYPSNDLVQAY